MSTPIEMGSYNMLRTVSPRVHVVETSPTVPEFDNGRIMNRLVNTALTHGYRPQWFDMNPQDYERGEQKRLKTPSPTMSLKAIWPCTWKR